MTTQHLKKQNIPYRGVILSVICKKLMFMIGGTYTYIPTRRKGLNLLTYITTVFLL